MYSSFHFLPQVSQGGGRFKVSHLIDSVHRVNAMCDVSNLQNPAIMAFLLSLSPRAYNDCAAVTELISQCSGWTTSERKIPPLYLNSI